MTSYSTSTPGSEHGSIRSAHHSPGFPEPKSRRKTHVKSRSGCRRCKTRRVKCDERQPACGACQKRSELCVYEADKTALTSPTSPLQSTLPLDTVRARELALFHHWTAITCESLSNEDNLHEMRITVPQLALSHDYLLNAIFAITTAHMAYLNPQQSQQHVLLALQFHSTSLRSFRPTLATISPAESPALVYCSILLGMITLGLRSVDDRAGALPIDTLCQISNLWRGTGSIKDVAGLSADSIMAADTPSASGVRSPATGFTSQRDAFFDRLLEAAVDHPDEAASKHYTHAIEELKPNIQWADSGVTAGALRWVPAISVEMVAMMQRREALAVAITLFFCSLLKGSENHWWMGSFSNDLLEELGQIIYADHPSLEPELQWVSETLSRDEGAV